MAAEEIDTLVVGAGQAGIAMSEHLSRQGAPHLVLEKNRIAEAWRTGRWDNLVTNGPVWHDRFPNLEFKGNHPDAFVPKDRVADYLVEYAEMIEAPIRTGVEVKEAVRVPGAPGFRVTTSQGEILARRIVAATGAFQHPVIPPIVPEQPGLTQLHSFHYRNPDALPEGAVMIVGAGSSGAQIADELNRATPRAQAALLECMAERQISVEGRTYELERPFFVIATQNPIEHEGTFDLPEAQLDRFLMRLAIGYPDESAEDSQSAPPVNPNSVTQPSAITMGPAAGPLMVSSELLMKADTIPPTIAVKTPAIAG